jgi:hypothetical protein
MTAFRNWGVYLLTHSSCWVENSHRIYDTCEVTKTIPSGTTVDFVLALPITGYCSTDSRAWLVFAKACSSNEGEGGNR